MLGTCMLHSSDGRHMTVNPVEFSYLIHSAVLHASHRLTHTTHSFLNLHDKNKIELNNK